MAEADVMTQENDATITAEDDALLDLIDVRLLDRSEVITASTMDGNANSD